MAENRIFTEFTKGEKVTVRTEEALFGPSVFRGRLVRPGTAGTITSVANQFSINVRFQGHHHVLTVSHNQIERVDPAAAAIKAEQERVAREAKIASMRPKEGDIMPDDPRLQWLWRQIADKAERASWCETFDEITDEFGIPGRERDFKVDFRVSSLATTTSVKVLSNAEAVKKVLAAFPTATDIKVNGKTVGATNE